MGKSVHEKDLEPAKNKAIAFSFTALAVALLAAGFSTFQDDFTLKWICIVVGVLFLFLGVRLAVLLIKYKATAKKDLPQRP